MTIGIDAARRMASATVFVDNAVSILRDPGLTKPAQLQTRALAAQSASDVALAASLLDEAGATLEGVNDPVLRGAVAHASSNARAAVKELERGSVPRKLDSAELSATAALTRLRDPSRIGAFDGLAPGPATWNHASPHTADAEQLAHHLRGIRDARLAMVDSLSIREIDSKTHKVVVDASAFTRAADAEALHSSEAIAVHERMGAASVLRDSEVRGTALANRLRVDDLTGSEHVRPQHDDLRREAREWFLHRGRTFERTIATTTGHSISPASTTVFDQLTEPVVRGALGRLSTRGMAREAAEERLEQFARPVRQHVKEFDGPIRKLEDRYRHASAPEQSMRQLMLEASTQNDRILDQVRRSAADVSRRVEMALDVNDGV